MHVRTRRKLTCSFTTSCGAASHAAHRLDHPVKQSAVDERDCAGRRCDVNVPFFVPLSPRGRRHGSQGRQHCPGRTAAYAGFISTAPGAVRIAPDGKSSLAGRVDVASRGRSASRRGGRGRLPPFTGAFPWRPGPASAARWSSRVYAACQRTDQEGPRINGRVHRSAQSRAGHRRGREPASALWLVAAARPSARPSGETFPSGSRA